MARVYEQLDDRLSSFLRWQHVFFVATAPLAPDGRVNLSPKGMETFRVLGPRRVAYLDLTGSGVETIAHLRENGRITMMFCAFEGKPRIVRLYGQGKVRLPGGRQFEELVSMFPVYPGVRSVIDVELNRIADSCGFAVPRLDFVQERDELVKWSLAKGEEGLSEYRVRHNATSVDELPGLEGQSFAPD
jgi:hypothetical protein